VNTFSHFSQILTAPLFRRDRPAGGSGDWRAGPQAVAKRTHSDPSTENQSSV